jgi:hypothetical protein
VKGVCRPLEIQCAGCTNSTLASAVSSALLRLPRARAIRWRRASVLIHGIRGTFMCPRCPKIEWTSRGASGHGQLRHAQNPFTQDWLARRQRAAVRRGTHRSTVELQQAIRSYLQVYKRDPRSIRSSTASNDSACELLTQDTRPLALVMLCSTPTCRLLRRQTTARRRGGTGVQ